MHDGKTPIKEATLLNTIKLFLDQLQKTISNRINRLETKHERLEKQMATLQEAQAKQAAAILATQNAVKRVVDENTRQNTLIKDLQDKIAAGGSITEADLDPLVSGNDQIIALVEGLDNIPAPTPVP